MIWVESTGGPLVLMPKTAAAMWRGTEVDYWRACEAGLTFDVPGPLLLFDASAAGSDLTIETSEPQRYPRDYTRTENALECTIAPGRYQVESSDLEPDEKTCLRVHRLRPISKP